jgi:hypothetical protein
MFLISQESEHPNRLNVFKYKGVKNNGFNNRNPNYRRESHKQKFVELPF